MLRYGSYLGGGIYGIGVTKFNHLLSERVTDQRDFMDGFGGVSAGAIIAALYASGKNSAQIDYIFTRDYRDMFKKNSVIQRMRPSKGRYNSESVEGVLQKNLGDIKFKDLKKELYIVAFRSYTPGDEYSDNYYVFSKQNTPELEVWKAVRASMAAKPYFEPFMIDGIEYCDGGYIENNPSMTIITELAREGVSSENIAILQLNTAGSTKNIRFMDLTLIQLAKNFVSRTIQGDSSVSTIQARNMIGDRLCVVNPLVKEDYGIDGIGYVTQIRRLWEDEYKRSYQRVMKWCQYSNK